MINDQILDYIKHQLDAGATRESIQTNLLSSGWSLADISEGFAALETKQNIVAGAVPVAPIKYAGFWIRYVAAVVDGFVLFIPSLVVGIVFGILLVVLKFSPENLIVKSISYLIGFIVTWGYYILMTYYKQATLGKKLVGIVVKSENTESLSLSQVIWRETIGKILSAITLCIGFIMAAFTAKKQALHDKIAHTVVVYKDPTKKHSVWVKVVIAFAGVMVGLMIFGMLAAIILASLNSAREKAREAGMMADLTGIGANIIEYGIKHNTFSVANDCSSGVFAEENIQKTITADPTNKQFTCYSNEKNFAISEKMEYSDSYCVDYDGYRGKGEATIGSSGASCKPLFAPLN